MRAFSPAEKRNMEYLVKRNVKFTLVQITSTGLKKSIMDATAPIRTFLKENGIHDYEAQSKGPMHKVTLSSHILTDFKDIPTQTSLYRPETKDGDPRFWVYRLKENTAADDIHVILTDGELYVINLTRTDIPSLCESSIANPVNDLISRLSDDADSVSKELLSRLMFYKGSWVDTNLCSDTGIGRQVEALLGIPMNSSKQPDYNGIELKSFRSKRPGIRKNLFCKVPDWDISYLKSGSEIVRRYGYLSDGCMSYRNTLRCSSPNTQNLRLSMNYPDSLLEIEEDAISSTGVFNKKADVAVWRLQTLHNALLTKHHETFWIEVDTKIGDEGWEQFMFKRIEHTRNPIVSQFDVLLEQSLITVDLLLGRPKEKKGGDSVSFKINKKATNLLFPESVFYNF